VGDARGAKGRSPRVMRGKLDRAEGEIREILKRPRAPGSTTPLRQNKKEDKKQGRHDMQGGNGQACREVGRTIARRKMIEARRKEEDPPLRCVKWKTRS